MIADFFISRSSVLKYQTPLLPTMRSRITGYYPRSFEVAYYDRKEESKGEMGINENRSSPLLMPMD